MTIGFIITALRYLVGALLLLLAATEYNARTSLLAEQPTDTKSITLALMIGGGASILLHVIVDSLIEKQARAGKASETRLIPKYRMENKRLLANALIVTSGVILGLAKSRSGGIVLLDTAFLASGIIFGFINLSVHGGAVDAEIDQKFPPAAQQERISEETFKYVRVKKFHDSVSTLLLNLQYLALILGIVALR